jgi:hypothetical protein
LKGGPKKEKKPKPEPAPEATEKKEKKEKKAKEPEKIYVDNTPVGQFKEIEGFYPESYQPNC